MKYAFLVLIASMLVGCFGCSKKKGVDPVEPPIISQFSATPSDILPGDSTILTYSITGAESVTLQPGSISLSQVTSGSFYIKPSIPTIYSLIAVNEGGNDSSGLSITMSGAVPMITNFSLSKSIVLIGDSSILSWNALRADSVTLSTPTGVKKFGIPGQLSIAPNNSFNYQAIAANNIGADSAYAFLTVENPVSVTPANGLFYKGDMGSSLILPELKFWVLDSNSNALTLPWTHFSLLSGDGTLTSDSLQGTSLPGYTFSGQLGHAKFQAMIRDIDTTVVNLRASTLTPGTVDGQGQFVILSDTYGDVKALNGLPASVDVDDGNPINYANYQLALGLVVAVFDENRSLEAEDHELILEIIVNTVFDKKTPDSVGIGTPVAKVRLAYGTPDTTWFDSASPPPNPSPPAQALSYDSLGMLVYVNVTGDSSVQEIHIWDPTPVAASKISSQKNLRQDGLTEISPHLRHRRFTVN